jgi:DNA replication protein DnaC
MHSNSADPSPQQLWLAERRDAALAHFDRRIPPLYAEPVTLPAPVAAWAESGQQQTGGLFLTGAIGVGKTHTAWTTTRAWLAASFTGAYRHNPVIEMWRSTSLFDALRPEGEDPRGVARRCQEADLLFIDDLAAARVSPTGWTQERLYELFDERYVRQRPVLITCDVLPRDLGPVVGPRVSSRLAEMCRGGVHRIDGHDLRKGGIQ